MDCNVNKQMANTNRTHQIKNDTEMYKWTVLGRPSPGLKMIKMKPIHKHV